MQLAIEDGKGNKEVIQKLESTRMGVKDGGMAGDALDYAYVNYSFEAQMMRRDLNPEEVLIQIDAVIHCTDERGKPKDVGAARCFWMDFQIMRDHHHTVVETLDSDPRSAEYTDLLDLEHDGLESSVARQFGVEKEIPSMLIGDRIHIDREYRGFEMAGRICDDMERRFRSSPLIVIKPFPLQLEPEGKPIDRLQREETGLGDFPSDQETAEGQLRGYYERLGFEKIENTELMGKANKYYR